jgi:hypothetical protein
MTLRQYFVNSTDKAWRVFAVSARHADLQAFVIEAKPGFLEHAPFDPVLPSPDLSAM